MSAANAKIQDPSMEEILASIRRIIADDGEGVKAPGPDASAAAGGGLEADEGDDDVLDLADLPEAERAAGAGSTEAAEAAPWPLVGPSSGELGDTATYRPEPHASRLLTPKPVAAKPRRPEAAEPAPATSAANHSRLGSLDVEIPDLSFADVGPEAAPVIARAEPPPASSHPKEAEPARAVPAAGAEPLVSSETTASVGQAFNLLSRTVLARDSQTLEDLVAAMLKPMLREWLDDNLPPLVERLVRAEIERVARGPR